MKIRNNQQKFIVIAPMGDHMDGIFMGLNEFPTEKVVLISASKMKEEAERVKSELDRYHVPSHVIHIEGTTETEIWENTFKAVCQINSCAEESDLLVNVGTGDSNTRCAATSAAFANGIPAFAASGDRIVMLPFMKFSYYKMIPDRKMDILKMLHRETSCSSMKELSKRTQMSMPLISYHINGNLKSEGLKLMGLVEIKEDKNKVAVELSSLGRLVVAGYV